MRNIQIKAGFTVHVYAVPESVDNIDIYEGCPLSMQTFLITPNSFMITK